MRASTGHRAGSLVLVGVLLLATGLSGGLLGLGGSGRQAGLVGGHAPQAAPCVRTDARMQRIWAGSGSGWEAGDGAISFRLGPATTAWLFGDSMLHDKFTGEREFVRNVVVTLGTDGPRVALPGVMTSYFRIPGADESRSWLWPNHGIVRGDSVWVFLSQERGSSDIPMDWTYDDTLWLARLSRDSLAIRSLERWTGPADVMWGAWLVPRGNYVYIYGIEHVGSNHDVLHLARATRIEKPGTWRYWNGRAWSASPTASAPLLRGIGDQVSIVPVKGRFSLLTTSGLHAHKALVFSARRLEGPWRRTGDLHLPAAGGAPIYALSAHPELSRSALVVSYSQWISGASPREPRFARVAWRCLAAG